MLTSWAAGRVINASVIINELRNQAREWYQHLPKTISFPLDATPVLDPRKSFLRGQYFALFVVMNWPAVLQVMEYGAMPDESVVDPETLASTRERAQDCIRSAMLYISVADEQLMGRKLGTHLSIWA
jgi:hypothetical protein